MLPEKSVGKVLEAKVVAVGSGARDNVSVIHVICSELYAVDEMSYLNYIVGRFRISLVFRSFLMIISF